MGSSNAAELVAVLRSSLSQCELEGQGRHPSSSEGACPKLAGSGEGRGAQGRAVCTEKREGVQEILPGP